MQQRARAPRLVFLAILLGLSGCVSTTVVFTMTPDTGWDVDASACSGPSGNFGQSLDDGVRIGFVPTPNGSYVTPDTQLKFAFQLDRGKTIRFLGSTVTIALPDGSIVEKPLPRFTIVTTILQPNASIAEKEMARVANDRSLPGDALLVGDRGNGAPRIGRSGKVEGEAAIFRSSIQVSPNVIASFRVRFPEIEVNGNRRSIGEKTFEKKAVRFVQCIQ